MAELPPITVAEEDYNRLSTLLERVAGQSDVADGLEDELSRADMKPLADMPEGVVVLKNGCMCCSGENPGAELERILDMLLGLRDVDLRL